MIEILNDVKVELGKNTNEYLVKAFHFKSLVILI